MAEEEKESSDVTSESDYWEERESDPESWDEEDSEESSPENLESYEKRFISLVDNKIISAETFCDHKDYVLSFVKPTTNDEEFANPKVTAKESQPTIRNVETQTAEKEIEPTGAFLDQHQSFIPPPISLEYIIDSARDEIAELRINREVFVAQRKEVSDRLKHNETETDSTRLYECEEAIDVIDTIIEYKNETICGKTNASVPLLQDMSGAEVMMTRLKNLSLVELSRLFNRYFTKVVELRLNSKELEKNVDQLEDQIVENKQLVRRYKKKLKIQEDNFKMLMDQSKHQPQASRYEDSYENHHRSQYSRQEHGSSSKHYRNGVGVYESVREHHPSRDRHRSNVKGTEVIRDHRKITILQTQKH